MKNNIRPFILKNIYTTTYIVYIETVTFQISKKNKNNQFKENEEK